MANYELVGRGRLDHRRRPDRRARLRHARRGRGRHGGGAGRAARPRGGDGRLHDVARVRQEARADQAQPEGRARLPRARARLRRQRSYVLVQGVARPITDPDRDYIENVLKPKAERFMGPPKRGVFWDRWLQAYYADRVPVTVEVEKVLTWPGRRAGQLAAVAVAAEERHGPARQAGRAPTFRTACSAGSARDGFPEVVPFDGRADRRRDDRGRVGRPACRRASAAPACSRTTTTRS